MSQQAIQHEHLCYSWNFNLTAHWNVNNGGRIPNSCPLHTLLTASLSPLLQLHTKCSSTAGVAALLIMNSNCMIWSWSTITSGEAFGCNPWRLKVFKVRSPSSTPPRPDKGFISSMGVVWDIGQLLHRSAIQLIISYCRLRDYSLSAQPVYLAQR